MQPMTITIEDQSESLSATEFADFLYFFRAANLALRDIVPSQDHNESRDPTTVELAEYRKSLGKNSIRELNSLFEPKTALESFRITHIARKSPLELVIIGCPFLLTLAVIFSGGKLSVPGGTHAVLPPLGKGVKALREALSLDKTVQAGFGIRDARIKLTKEEFDALMQQDSRTKRDGGFQRFLVGLQDRTNSQTREVDLSQRDLGRILRYKSNPKKGGWQSRFNKIFGRHFP